MTNYGLLFRYARLQTQLKASEENSNVIVAQIKRFRTIQVFLYINMSLYALFFVVRIVFYEVLVLKYNNPILFFELKRLYYDPFQGVSFITSMCIVYL